MDARTTDRNTSSGVEGALELAMKPLMLHPNRPEYPSRTIGMEISWFLFYSFCFACSFPWTAGAAARAIDRTPPSPQDILYKYSTTTPQKHNPIYVEAQHMTAFLRFVAWNRPELGMPPTPSFQYASV